MISLEEHSVIGGLGSAVAQLVAEGARHPQGQFKIMGIPDCFPGKYGGQGDLINYFGLEEHAIYFEVQQMLSTSEAIDSEKI